MYKDKTDKFIQRSQKIHGDKYDYSLVEYKNSKLKVDIMCPDHGVFEQTPDTHLNGSGCRACGYIKNSKTGRNTTSNFIERSNDIHKGKYDYSLVEYKNSKLKVDIMCPDHGIFKQRPNDHLSGLGCPVCANNIRFTTEEFIEKSISIHGDKYDYSLVKYTNRNEKVNIICREHGEFKQLPSSHKRGNGCRECAGNLKCTILDFIHKSREVHRDRYDYSKSVYSSALNKLIIICEEHGEFKQTPNKHITLSQGCPRCTKSKGINKICNILEDNNILFEIERKIPGCVSPKNRPYFFDIYIESFDIYIEFDGVQHFRPVSLFGGESGFVTRKKNDTIKDNFCHDNDISLFRISYDDDIVKEMSDIITTYHHLSSS